MQVFENPIPLTNIEAFAIVRRNRDSRYAKALPAFGIQSKTPAGMQSSALSAPFPRRETKASARDAAQRATAEFFAQNTVALSEVRCLFYLQHQTHPDTRGPTSVYSASFKPTTSSTSPSANEDETTKEIAGSNFFAINGFGAVGTRQHVNAVSKELELLEKAGRSSEVRVVQRLRDIAAAMPAPKLTEFEVRNLIDCRPRNELEVSAIIPNLESRLADNEDNVSRFAQAVVEVFKINQSAEQSL